ncbi:cytidine/deoxycytidylate deaminase family protein [Thermodesulfobacteriota bacterium]
MRPDWNEYFMVIAKIISTRSTCNSRPSGAVIVKDKQILTTGYNGSMPGAPHCIDHAADENGNPFCFRRSMGAPENDKYNYCRASHAEANAIAQAAKKGISLEDSTLYVTLAPCYQCLKLLSTARVKNIYFEYEYESTDKKRDQFWKNAIKGAGIIIFKELRVSEPTIRSITTALQYPTSIRRISEKGESLRQLCSPLGFVTEDMTQVSAYKAALLNVLMGRTISSRRIGTRLETVIGINLQDQSYKSGERYRSAMSFLNELSLTDNGTLHSGILSELFEKTRSAGNESTAIRGERFEIRSAIESGIVNVHLKVDKVDILERYLSLLDAVKIIYADLYLNLLDHADITLKEGEVKITVNKPSIEVSSTEKAKEVLISL